MRFRFVGFALVALAATPAFSADAAKGKTAFMKHGCWQCHGEVGQGGAAGNRMSEELFRLEICIFPHIAMMERMCRGGKPFGVRNAST